MNLFYVSRSHVRSVEKATTMSKRIETGRWKNEPAVAKPRSVCLISLSSNCEQFSSFGPDVSNIPENPQLDSGSVKEATGNCERDIVHNQSQRSCGKLQGDYVQGNMPKSSGSCGKRHRKIEIQPQTTAITCK